MQSATARMRPLRAIAMIGVLPIAVLAISTGTAYAEDCNQYQGDAAQHCANAQTWGALADNHEARANEYESNPNMSKQRLNELKEQDAIDTHVEQRQDQIQRMQEEQRGR